MTGCAHEDCGRTIVARGRCSAHYQELRRTEGIVKPQAASSAWYCDGCTSGRPKGSVPCRECCGYKAVTP